jgi:FMN phosphatase YigB (HAD superfamily)
VEVLRELGRTGVRRIILSNIDRDLLEETIRRNHLEVDGFVTSEDVRSYKPSPSHWLEFFRRYPEDRRTTLHVAHSLVHDIVPAGKLGMRTVWVDRYGEPRPPSIRPTYTLRDLRGLLELVAM